MSYKVKINTQKYVDKGPNRCSKKNWERGTVYDYMCAINGYTATEQNLREVGWRLELFRGQTWLQSEYSDSNPEEQYGMSDRYTKWLAKKCNMIEYHDRMCDLTRKQVPSGYGWMQGYFSAGDKIKQLKEKGYVRIYFHELYDLRQYDKKMDGCYMEIWNNKKVNYDEAVAAYN